MQYMSKEDVLNQYQGYMSDYAALLDEFENDNPFKANYRVSLSDLSQMETMSKKIRGHQRRLQRHRPHRDDQDLRGDPAGRHQGRARSWCWC